MHGHAHYHDGRGDHVTAATKRLLTFITLPLIALTVIGFFLLRPLDRPEISDAIELPNNLFNGTVTSIEAVPCPGLETEGPDCRVAEVRLTEGPDEGDIVQFQVGDVGAIRTMEQGAEIVVSQTETEPGTVIYDFADVQRSDPIVLLALIFVAVVIALGRLRGLLALVGIGISLMILIQFVLPAILSGRNPLAVSLVGSAGVMFLPLSRHQRAHDVGGSRHLGQPCHHGVSRRPFRGANAADRLCF
jgi:hypothetical protein